MFKTIKLAAASATLAVAVAAGASGAVASPLIAKDTEVARSTIKASVKPRLHIRGPRCHRTYRIRSVRLSMLKLRYKGYRYIRFLRYTPKRVRTYRRFPPYRVCIGGWYTFTAWRGAFKYRIVTNAYTGRIVRRMVIGRIMGANERH